MISALKPYVIFAALVASTFATACLLYLSLPPRATVLPSRQMFNHLESFFESLYDRLIGRHGDPRYYMKTNVFTRFNLFD